MIPAAGWPETKSPGVLEWALFADWVQATKGNLGEHTPGEFEDSLKNLGFVAYEDGEGFPHLDSWYNGPIEPGMAFVWAPRKTAQRTVVTRVLGRRGEEAIIWSKWNGREIFNEEWSWRLNCIPDPRVMVDRPAAASSV